MIPLPINPNEESEEPRQVEAEVKILSFLAPILGRN